VVFVGAGIACQVLQIAYSVWKRKELHVTGDPWGGRTLEWSVPSPAPFYNYAIIPKVNRVDEWWYQKEEGVKAPKDSEYKDIVMPKNTSFGFIIGMTAFVLSGALIWHIWWLVILTFIAVVAMIIMRTMDDFTEYTIPAAEVMKMDKEARA